MKLENTDKEKKKPVLPPGQGKASEGTLTEKKAPRADSGAAQRPLEERQVVRTAGNLSETEKSGGAGELDWALERMPGRKAKGETEKHGESTAVMEEEAPSKAEERIKGFGRVGQWFQTICWINIPIFGVIYLLVLALRRKTPTQKKAFARAYLLYKLLVLVIALTILYVLYKVGLSFVAEILRYAGSALGG